MKILNNKGEDITIMFKDFMEKMKTTLEFYEDKKYMEWEGCHCHGRYVDVDDGQEARNALDSYRDLLNELEKEEDES